MKKLLVIIHSWTSGDEREFRQGVVRDARSIAATFRSSTLGAWDPMREIVHLRNPSASDLHQLRQSMVGLDLAVVYYTGHGLMRGEQSLLNINDHEEFPVMSLFAKCVRQLVILDTCQVDPYRSFSGLGEIGDPFDGLDCRDPSYARKVYNQLVEKCPFGKAILFSSSFGQYSYADAYGGTFTKHLTNVAHNYESHAQRGFFPLLNTFRTVRKSVINARRRMDQVPMLRTNNQEFVERFPLLINPEYFYERAMQRSRRNW